MRVDIFARVFLYTILNISICNVNHLRTSEPTTASKLPQTLIHPILSPPYIIDTVHVRMRLTPVGGWSTRIRICLLYTRVVSSHQPLHNPGSSCGRRHARMGRRRRRQCLHNLNLLVNKILCSGEGAAAGTAVDWARDRATELVVFGADVTPERPNGERVILPDDRASAWKISGQLPGLPVRFSTRARTREYDLC